MFEVGGGAFRWAGIAAVASLATSSFAWFAERSVDWDWPSLLGLAFVVGVAFLAGRETGLIRTGALVGMVMTDTGWFVSALLNWLVPEDRPCLGDLCGLGFGEGLALLLLIGLLVVSLFGAAVGLLGGWLGTLAQRRSRTQLARAKLGKSESAPPSARPLRRRWTTSSEARGRPKR